MLETTLSNRHQPHYSLQAMDKAFADGHPEAVLRMAEWQRMFPTRRFWHHHVRASFGLSCDELCAPSPRRTGGGLIDRIKAAYRIEDIAEKHTKLRGTHTLSGPCFLHAGSGSEFVIWIDEQKWQCFGRCGLYGDVIDLVEAMEERGIDWR